jgi:hypothetical protein
LERFGLDDITAVTHNMRGILADHATRYPSWCADDLYKLVHQSALGSEHAVTDEATAREGLAHEFISLGSGPEEPLIDPISPEGEIVRVHLRPYVRNGLDERLLLGAFLSTARDFRGAPERTERYARIAVSLAGEINLNIPTETIKGFLEAMRVQGFPAVHHSPEYQARYRPAYRVVARRFIPPGILEAG